MKFIHYLSLIIFFLTSCSTNVPEKKTIKKEQKEIESEIVLPEHGIEQTTEKNDDEKRFKRIKQIIDKIENKVPTLELAVAFNHNYHFIFSDRNFKEDLKINLKFPETTEIGLCDSSGNILLEQKYTRIANYDVLASGYAEVCEDDKFGLFNYLTQTLAVTPQYDYFIPSKTENILCYGVKKDKTYAIDKNYNPSVLNTNFNLAEVLKNNPYNVNNKDTKLYINIENIEHKEGLYLLYASSFHNQFKFIPRVDPFVLGPDGYMGTAEANTKIKIASKTDANTSFISSFFEEVAEGRGYIGTTEYLSTVNNKNEVTNVEIAENSSDNFGFSCSTFSYKFINDSLLEVYHGKNYTYQSTKDGLHDFQHLYSYYAIEQNGKIERLYENSVFPTPSLIPLEQRHFQVCSADFTKGEEEEYDDGSIIMIKHLSLRDLQFMRNEIFARHNYIFKTEKYAHFFSENPNYKAEFTNVDSLLTPLERENLIIIRSQEELLKQNEEKFTQPEKGFYAVAG